MVHEALSIFLSPASDIQIVGGAYDGITGLQQVAHLHPDVVILDVRLRGALSGVVVAQQIRTACPAVAILALTAYEDIIAYQTLVQLGVRGYLLKSASGERLREVVRLLAEGKTVLDINEEAARVAASIAALTAQEYAVLQWLAAGRTNAAIGQALHLSEKSAEVYVSRVLHKLGVRSRAEAISKAYEYGFVLTDGFVARTLGVR
jgi:DNA-binding NarL/FixJ family response regulator